MQSVTIFSCIEIFKTVEATSAKERLTLKLSNIRSSGDSIWVDKVDEIMSLKQKFHTLDVNLDASHGQNSVEMFVDITLHHGSHVRVLILHKADFHNPKDFCDILRNVRLLEELEVSRTSFDLSEDDDDFEVEAAYNVRPVKLKHLKIIKVVYSSWKLFQYLIGSQITTLLASTAQVRKSERESLISFLEASQKLEYIEIDREGFERIFTTSFSRDFPFKLKNFKFFSYTFKSEVNQVDANFIAFLESQASSLEELTFEYSSREILQTIFTKLKNLRKLKLNSNSLPTDKEFYDQLEPFEYLKEFDADDRIQNETAAMGILRNLPNLEILRVECDPNDVISEILPFIAYNNPDLRTLQIDSLKANHAIDVKFEYLEEFHVFLFKDADILLSFIRNNPTITTLKVKWVYEQSFIDDVLDALMSETSVKHLKLGCKLDTARAIYDKIKHDHRNLRSLELRFKADSIERISYIEFPEDPSKWELKSDYFDSPHWTKYDLLW